MKTKGLHAFSTVVWATTSAHSRNENYQVAICDGSQRATAIATGCVPTYGLFNMQIRMAVSQMDTIRNILSYATRYTAYACVDCVLWSFLLQLGSVQYDKIATTDGP